MRAKSKELKPRLTLMTRASLNCRESSILRCTAVVRSVPWIKRVATRHIRTTIPQSYRVSSPEASNFGRRISGVGNQQHWMRASGIAGAGIRRQKSRALDDAACGSVQSPASTNASDNHVRGIVAEAGKMAQPTRRSGEHTNCGSSQLFVAYPGSRA